MENRDRTLIIGWGTALLAIICYSIALLIHIRFHFSGDAHVAGWFYKLGLVLNIATYIFPIFLCLNKRLLAGLILLFFALFGIPASSAVIGSIPMLFRIIDAFSSGDSDQTTSKNPPSEPTTVVSDNSSTQENQSSTKIDPENYACVTHKGIEECDKLCARIKSIHDTSTKPFTQSTQGQLNNIVFLFDKSGSMAANQKIDSAKNALSLAYRVLSKNVKVSFIAYDYNSIISTDIPPADLLYIDAFHKRLESIRALGKTNLRLGLLQALMHLAKLSTEKNMIFLLTDDNQTNTNNEFIKDLNTSLELNAITNLKAEKVPTSVFFLGENSPQNLKSYVEISGGTLHYGLNHCLIENVLLDELTKMGLNKYSIRN